MNEPEYSDLPDWCRPGERAIMMWWGQMDAVYPVTVARILKHHVVVTDKDGKETKFYRRGLGEVHARDRWSGGSHRLHPVGDPQVTQARRRIRLKRIITDLRAAMDACDLKLPANIPHLRAEIRCLETAAADAIEALNALGNGETTNEAS